MKSIDNIGANAEFDARFTSGDWGRVGGNIQSIIFAQKALHVLITGQRALADYIVHGPLVDYGCALGDGTAVLAACFQGVPVTGCDISAAAIHEAAQRWPTINFRQDDIRHPTIDAHCIWTSHTLEHLRHPATAVTKLRQRCHILVAMFPVLTDEEDNTHKGAPTTKSWLRTLEAPLFSTQFTTPRFDVLGTDGGMFLETSLLIVWRGLRR